MDEHVVLKTAPDPDGDRVGLEFSLGERTAAWTFLEFRLFGGKRKDRLHLYAGGVARLSNRDPGRTVLRWADLADITLSVEAGADGDHVDSCDLRDRDGQALTIPGRSGAADEIAPIVEQALAATLLPNLIARYEAGEAITIDRITIDQESISHPDAGQHRWTGLHGVGLRAHGHMVLLRHGPNQGDLTIMRQAGAPNAFLAGYLITHAAGASGIEVASGLAPL
jgi:hypothetical protein